MREITRHSLWMASVLTLSFLGCSEVQTVAVDGGQAEDDAGVLTLCAQVTCDDSNGCSNDACDPSSGDCVFPHAANGSFCDFSGSTGQCAAGECEDAELCQDAAMRCDDTNECTEDTCNGANGVCVPEPIANGTSCDFGGSPGVCTDGTCEDAMLCSDAPLRCDDSNQCTDDTCDPASGVCAHAARSGFCSSSVVNLGPVLSDCIGGVCVQRFCDANNDCNDNDDCTTDSCDSFSNRCTNPNAPSGTRCNGGTGRCSFLVFGGSICVPDIIIGN